MATVFVNSLNLFMSVVVAVAKFARSVVLSCAISVNDDVSPIISPLISAFAAYARVLELVCFLRTSLNAREN